jgi:hypothetical protein
MQPIVEPANAKFVHHMVGREFVTGKDLPRIVAHGGRHSHYRRPRSSRVPAVACSPMLCYLIAPTYE